MTMFLPVYEVKCEGCPRWFQWRPNDVREVPPNYHSKRCRESKRLRLKNAMPVKCPHPWKRLYRSHEEAQNACNEMEDQYMKPYRCRCGGLHVGHAKIRIKDWIEV